MPRLTIGLGSILIILGVIAYIATAFASWTALIPAVLGAVILICGLVGLKNARVGTIIALIVAVLGILGTSMNVMELGALVAGEAERPAAVITSVITFVLLIIYVIFGVRALMTTRKNAVEA